LYFCSRNEECLQNILQDAIAHYDEEQFWTIFAIKQFCTAHFDRIEYIFYFITLMLILMEKTE
jgi:hypothetical protein